jgi:hypothetical protein
MGPRNENNFLIEVTPEIMSKIHRLLIEEDDDIIELHYSPYWKEMKGQTNDTK